MPGRTPVPPARFRTFGERLPEHRIAQGSPMTRTTGRVGFAPGVFDLFHVGHLNILRRAKSQCDFLIAGVSSDELCLQKKGHLPYVPLQERLAIVAGIRYVDSVRVEEQPESPLASWYETPFDVIFKGDDCKESPTWRALTDDFARLGVRVVYFPYTVQTSSTLVAAALERAVGTLEPVGGRRPGGKQAVGA